MIWKPKWTNRPEEPAEIEASDPALKQALGDFKASVRAWSDAAYSRPRTARAVIVRRSWRGAAGWGFAVVLLAGTVSGGFYEHRQREIAAQLAAQRAAELHRQETAQRAKDEAQLEEDMLASVDMDVSREVPSAMEPLAQLSEESESR